MANKVLNYSDIKLKNIILKKCVFESENYYTIPLKYKIGDEKMDIIIQSPNMPIMNDIIEYETCNCKKKYFIDFSIKDENVNNDIKLFKKFIKKIDKFTKSKIPLWKKKTKIEPQNFSSSYKLDKKNQNFYRFRLNSMNNDININVFDEKKQKLNKVNILPDIYASCIICLEALWLYNGSYGYILNVFQIKLVLKRVLTNYAFREEDNKEYINKEYVNKEYVNKEYVNKEYVNKEYVNRENICNNQNINNNLLKDNPKYSKYFKMLKMKIPKASIKQKMTMDGLDPGIIDKDPNEIYTDNIIELAIKDTPTYAKYFKMLKMNIPKSSIKNKLKLDGYEPEIIDLDPNKPYVDKTDNKISILSELMNTKHVLKKVVIDTKQKYKMKPLSDGFEPPSVEILLNMRNKLKKTNYIK